MLAGVNLTHPARRLRAGRRPGAAGRPARRGQHRVRREGRLVGGNTDVAGAVWALGSQLALRDDTAGRATARPYCSAPAGSPWRWRSPGAAWPRPAGTTASPVAPLQVAGRDGAHASRRGRPGWSRRPCGGRAGRLAGRRRRRARPGHHLTARGEPVPGQDRLRSEVRVLDYGYGPASQGLVTAPARPGRRPPPTARHALLPGRRSGGNDRPGPPPTWTPWPPPNRPPGRPQPDLKRTVAGSGSVVPEPGTTALQVEEAGHGPGPSAGQRSPTAGAGRRWPIRCGGPASQLNALGSRIGSVRPGAGRRRAATGQLPPRANWPRWGLVARDEVGNGRERLWRSGPTGWTCTRLSTTPTRRW